MCIFIIFHNVNAPELHFNTHVENLWERYGIYCSKLSLDFPGWYEVLAAIFCNNNLSMLAIVFQSFIYDLLVLTIEITQICAKSKKITPNSYQMGDGGGEFRGIRAP